MAFVDVRLLVKQARKEKRDRFTYRAGPRLAREARFEHRSRAVRSVYAQFALTYAVGFTASFAPLVLTLVFSYSLTGAPAPTEASPTGISEAEVGVGLDALGV